MNLNGMDIVASPLMVETVTEERRVLGGYMNHWLIRQVVTEERPARRAIYDQLNRRIYVHPMLLESFRNAVR